MLQKDRFTYFKPTKTAEETEMLKKQRDMFMYHVNKLKSIDSVYVEADFELSFKKWCTSIGLTRPKMGDQRQPLFDDFCARLVELKDKSRMAERDAASRKACEMYRESPQEEYFEQWLANHEFLYVQANAKTMHPMKTKLKLDFGTWCEKLPWNGGMREFLRYLLTYDKGPSGMDNKAWANDCMRLLYLGTPEALMLLQEPDREGVARMAEGLPETGKTRPQMLKDVEEWQEPEGEPEAEPEPVEVEPEPSGARTPDYPAELDNDLESRRKQMEEELDNLRKQIALNNAQKINDSVKPTLTGLADGLDKKRSFQRMAEWRKALKALPPTKKAKKFKADCLATIKKTQEVEQAAIEARKVGRTELQAHVKAYFN